MPFFIALSGRATAPGALDAEGVRPGALGSSAAPGRFVRCQCAGRSPGAAGAVEKAEERPRNRAFCGGLRIAEEIWGSQNRT